ncbi:hypothetical protein [Rubrivirga sp.]|uniref:hypothetical protein n=1 Tax=Rubrivirga sp. TaxID=1885344 RepID=UPI003B52873F
MDTTPAWKRIAWALALVALVVAGDRALAAGLHSAVMHTGNRFAVLYRGDAPGGVLVLGNSRGVNTFHAPTLERALGRPVFNASANGAPTALSEVLLRDYVERNPAPELVVLEVTGVAGGVDQFATFFPFGAESARLDAYLDGAVPASVAAARRVSALFDYNGELLFRALGSAGASDQGQINRYTVSPELVEATRRGGPTELRARPENLDALGRIVAFCRAEGVELRLVIGPYLPAFREKIGTYDAWLARVRQAANGTPIWDYSNALDDPSLFADRLHMNHRGAQALTPILIADGLFDPATPPVPRPLRTPPAASPLPVGQSEGSGHTPSADGPPTRALSL